MGWGGGAGFQHGDLQGISDTRVLSPGCESPFCASVTLNELLDLSDLHSRIVRNGDNNASSESIGMGPLLLQQRWAYNICPISL